MALVSATQPNDAAGDGLVWIGRRALARLKAESRELRLGGLRIISRTAGGHLSRFKGRGMEFDEARPYQPGDDIRTIDWRVTARTGRPHTKLFREERERPVLFWVDFRAPMHFATRGAFKSVQATRVAALLAWSARARGERLGGLAFSEDGHHEIRPRGGDDGVFRLLGLLSDYSKAPAAETSQELRRNSILKSLTRLRRVTRPGSLVFLISDFRGLNPQCEVHLSALARHNDLVLIYLHDPLEAELPPKGHYPITDGRRRFTLRAGDGDLRRRHHERFDYRVEVMEGLCRRYRMHLLVLSTADDPALFLQDALGRAPR